MQRLVDGFGAGCHRSATTGFLAAVFAVVLWGASPVLRAQADQLPALQMTAMALMCACVMASLSRIPARPAAADAMPLGMWVLLAVNLVGAIALYFLGLNRAPAAQVTLITYVWPLMFVAAGEWLSVGRVRLVVLLGALIAFAGAAVLILRDGGTAVAAPHLVGYALGIGSGLCWTLYSLLMQRRGAVTLDGFPTLFAVGTVVAGAGHLVLEPSVWPVSAEAALVTAAIGVGPYGLAFIAWAHGIRTAPTRAVGPLTYGVPLVAAALLVALGLAEPSWRLGVAALAIVGGVAVTGLGGRPRAAQGTMM